MTINTNLRHACCVLFPSVQPTLLFGTFIAVVAIFNSWFMTIYLHFCWIASKHAKYVHLLGIYNILKTG